MPSESRNEPLEALLAARFDLLHCEDTERAECLRIYEALMEATCATRDCSRSDLDQAIRFQFIEYRRARLRSQRRRETL